MQRRRQDNQDKVDNEVKCKKKETNDSQPWKYGIWLILVTLVFYFPFCPFALLSVLLFLLCECFFGFPFGGVEPSRSGRNAEEFEMCKGLRGVWGLGRGATPLAHVAALERRENNQRHPKTSQERTKLLDQEEGRERRVKEQKSQGEEMGTSSTPGRPMDRDMRPKPGGGTVERGRDEERTAKDDRQSRAERREDRSG